MSCTDARTCNVQWFVQSAPVNGIDNFVFLFNKQMQIILYRDTKRERKKKKREIIEGG